MTYRVAIIMQNTLEALGIKHVLEESFSMSCHIYRSLAQVTDAGRDVFDFYFTDSDHYVLHLDFFLPR